MGDLWTHDALDCLMVDLLCAHSLSLLFLSTLVPPFILPSVSVRTYCPHGNKSLIQATVTSRNTVTKLAERRNVLIKPTRQGIAIGQANITIHLWLTCRQTCHIVETISCQ